MLDTQNQQTRGVVTSAVCDYGVCGSALAPVCFVIHRVDEVECMSLSLRLLADSVHVLQQYV